MSVDHKIERRLGVISETARKWKKEFNFIAWNGNPAKYDIRTWDPYNEPKRGVVLTLNELQKLYELIGAELERRKGETA